MHAAFALETTFHQGPLEALLELIDDMGKPGASGAGATTGTAMPSPIGYDELVAQVEALKAKASP